MVSLSTGSDIFMSMSTVLALRPCCISDRWFALACRICRARKTSETTTATPLEKLPIDARSESSMTHPLDVPGGDNSHACTPSHISMLVMSEVGRAQSTGRFELWAEPNASAEPDIFVPQPRPLQRGPRRECSPAHS